MIPYLLLCKVVEDVVLEHEVPLFPVFVFVTLFGEPSLFDASKRGLKGRWG